MLTRTIAVVLAAVIKTDPAEGWRISLPTVLPMIAVANLWLFFYTPNYGLLDQVLGRLGFGRHNSLGDPALALPSLMVVAVWKESGFFMIFYLAALQGTSPVLRDAGALEGAGWW